MKRLHLQIAVAVSLLVVCVGCQHGIQGSGISTTQTRELEEFKSIQHDSVGNVNVTIGSPQRVKVTFDDNLIDLLETKVVDGELQIKSTAAFSSDLGPKIEIVTPQVKAIRLAGVGNLTLNDLEADHLKLNLSGVGQLMGEGTVKTLDLTMSGVGQAKLDNLLAETVNVSVSGVGNAMVYATQSVDANTSGVGSIVVLGNPRIRTGKYTGIGKVTFEE